MLLLSLTMCPEVIAYVVSMARTFSAGIEGQKGGRTLFRMIYMGDSYRYKRKVGVGEEINVLRQSRVVILTVMK